MRCAEALEALLEAEPTDLTAGASSELALHLKSCSKCGRLAAAMRADLGALAAVMPARTPAQPVRVVRWPAVAFFATATLALFVVIRGAPEPRAHRQATSAPAAPATRETARQPAATPTRSAPASQTVYHSPERRYAMPDLASPLEPSTDQERTTPVWKGEVAVGGVSVPSDGGVMILKTSNPKFTIIWFN